MRDIVQFNKEDLSLACTFFFYTTCTDVDWCDVARVTIDTLPDVALIEIFDSYMYEEQIEAWYALVHVCRKWRKVVFGSPRRLNLRLYCRAGTPVRETLDVWPPLPIVVMIYGDEAWDEGDIVSALERNDRVCGIDLLSRVHVPNSGNWKNCSQQCSSHSRHSHVCRFIAKPVTK